MTVPRDYDPYAPNATQQTAPGIFDTPYDKILEAANTILLGRIERTSNFGGGTATVGPGENINTALQLMKTAGGGTVILRPGVYVLTADIYIPAGVTLEGASRDNVVIDCNSSYGIHIAGENEYLTGTISATNGDATVTGSGTTWTSDMAGRKILIDGFWYEIASVTNTTSLELTEAYTSTTVSGAEYVIATVNASAIIRTVTVHNATGTGITVRTALEPQLDDLYIYSCGTGIEMDYVVYPLIVVTATGCTDDGMNLFQTHGYKIDFSAFDFNGGNGITMDTSGDATFGDSLAQGNAGVGISLTDCYDTGFISSAVKDNTSHGIELVSGNRDLQFIAFTADGNGGDGYKLTATSDRITISSSTVINNGGYGVNIAAATCDDNYIIAPSFDDNASGDINDGGTNTTIISHFANNAVDIPIYQPINGASTPVPVMISSDGTAVTADANDNDLDEFHGFIKKDYSTDQTPAAFLNLTKSNSASFSVTANAGTNRALIVWFAVEGGTPSAAPTSMTWNSITGTKFADRTQNAFNLSGWVFAAGTSTSNTTATLQPSGGSYNTLSVFAVTYQHVNQSTPVGTAAINSLTTGTAGTTIGVALTPTQSYSLVATACVGGATVTLDAGATSRDTLALPAGGDAEVGDLYYTGLGANTLTHSLSVGGFARIIVSVEIKHATSTDAQVIISGRINGFTGLTVGASYYLSNTAGAISTTPGATSIKVGKALSATELVIIQS